MIIAIWRTPGCSLVESGSATIRDCVFSFPCNEEKSPCSLVTLDLQNLLFLGAADLVHLIDETIGELLQTVSTAFQLVLGNFLLLLTIAQFVMSITTHI